MTVVAVDWDAWLEQRRIEFDRSLTFQRVCLIDTVAATRGWAVLTMPVTDSMRNVRGAVHGGAISTLIDAAAGTAVAASAVPSEIRLSTITLNVSFIRAPSGSMLRAEARALNVGHAVAFARVEVSDDRRLVASGDVTLRLKALPDSGPDPRTGEESHA